MSTGCAGKDLDRLEQKFALRLHHFGDGEARSGKDPQPGAGGVGRALGQRDRAAEADAVAGIVGQLQLGKVEQVLHRQQMVWPILRAERFERDSLLEFITRHPHAAVQMLSVMGRRLRSAESLLRHNVVRNANVEADEQLTLGQRLADRVAAFGGSWTFIGSFFLLMLGWIVLNVRMLGHPYDPYPFILLNLLLSLVASIQAPVIMMSQNRQAAKDRVKSDLDYQVNFKAETEIAHLHKKIDQLYEVVQEHWAEREKEHKAGTQGKPQNDYY